VSETGPVVAPAESEASGDLPETLIRPRTGWESLQLVELWKARHLIYFLTWRDLKVRYKQTVLGALWAILQPVLLMVVFGQVFGGFVGKAPNDLPYNIFLYAGLLPWTFVSQATSKAAMSVASAERLVEKVYFPRLVIPISAVAGAFVDFGIALVVLIAMMFWYRVPPTATIVLFPVAIALLWLVSLGIGILYASVNIIYRDFRHLIGFLIQIRMFLTPSIYKPDLLTAPDAAPNAVVQASPSGTASRADAATASEKQAAEKHVVEQHAAKNADVKPSQPPTEDDVVRQRAHAWFSPLVLNPQTAIIAFFRATMLGGPIPWFMVAKATVVSLVLLSIGLIYFRRTEDRFADII
jgi:lipopolysaccharide transport system permease protein